MARRYGPDEELDLKDDEDGENVEGREITANAVATLMERSSTPPEDEVDEDLL